MPDNIRTWSTCAPFNPADQSSLDELRQFLASDPFEDNVGKFITGYIKGIMFGGVPLMLATMGFLAIFGQTIEAGCAVGTFIIGILIYNLIAAINWFNNFRLGCMEHDACAVGSIVHDPHSNGNGDIDLDILIAPHTTDHHDGMLSETVTETRGLSINNPIGVHNFVASLDGDEQLGMFMSMVENRVLVSPQEQRFQHKYLVHDFSGWGAPFDRDDYMAPPMYRCPSDGGSQEKMVPLNGQNIDRKQYGYIYLPCVVEGHVIVEWLKNMLYSMIPATAAFVAACIICMYYTGNDALCGVIASGAVILAFLLTLLFFSILNPPGATRADAGSIGNIPTTEEEAASQPLTSAERGDLIAVYGDWVFYIYNKQYYEIHPVRAWYLLSRQGKSNDKNESSLTADMISASDYERISAMVREAEEVLPAEERTVPANEALAMLGSI